MCNMLVSGEVFYRIEASVVYFEGDSGGETVRMSMPVEDFRIAHEQQRRLLADWDAGQISCVRELARHEPPRLRPVR